MLEDDTRQQGVPKRADRVVIATVPSTLFQLAHQRFVGKIVEQQPESFKVAKYNQGPPRGDLTLWGGFAQYKVGPVGTFNKWGLSTGYNKDYHFDSRLTGWSPPGYPATDRYVVVSWSDRD